MWSYADDIHLYIYKYILTEIKIVTLYAKYLPLH